MAPLAGSPISMAPILSNLLRRARGSPILAGSASRFYVNGNGSSGGQRRDDVARAEVCREDDVREVRGLGGVVFPS